MALRRGCSPDTWVRSYPTPTSFRPLQEPCTHCHDRCSAPSRAAGTTCWFAGEYRKARDHLGTCALFQPGRDDDLAFLDAHKNRAIAAQV